MHRAAPAVAVLLLAGCGSGASPPATPTFFARAASAYLLTLDELRTPGFTVSEAAHDATGEACPAATARYFRSVSELATSNGPVDVRTTVLRCPSVGAAAAAYSTLVARTDAVSGETAESAGALGDVAHADELRTTGDGVGLVEVTVTWRTANLVSVLVDRERDAGSGLADALILAHAQAAAAEQPQTTRG